MEFGFQPDSDVVYSDVMPGLSYDFGNFKLSAACLMNLRFAEVVMFSGILIGGRNMADVEFEMPRQVASREQCAAWIAWHLDRCADGDQFMPERDAPWLAEGRSHCATLPWVREFAGQIRRRAGGNSR
jgi:hypothetical protein